MPWASIGPFSANGFQGDGVLTFIAGVVLAILGVVLVTQRQPEAALPLGITISVVGFLAAAVAVGTLVNISDEPLNPSPGGGLLITLLGALVAMGGGAATLIMRSGRS